jgi:membrane protein YdbS with pleckstrin-like domain
MKRWHWIDRRSFVIQQMPRDSHGQPAILVIRPNARKLPMYYSAFVIPITAVVAVLVILPTHVLAFLIIGYVFAGAVFLWMAVVIISHRKQLLSSTYTVTQEYVAVEVDAGIFGRSRRQFPIASIQDMTVHSTMSQRFYDLASVTITAANGHWIIFEDITDAENVVKNIWQLVRQASSR